MTMHEELLAGLKAIDAALDKKLARLAAADALAEAVERASKTRSAAERKHGFPVIDAAEWRAITGAAAAYRAGAADMAEGERGRCPKCAGTGLKLPQLDAGTIDYRDVGKPCEACAPAAAPSPGPRCGLCGRLTDPGHYCGIENDQPPAASSGKRERPKFFGAQNGRWICGCGLYNPAARDICDTGKCERARPGGAERAEPERCGLCGREAGPGHYCGVEASTPPTLERKP